MPNILRKSAERGTFHTMVGVYINTMKTTFLFNFLHAFFSNYKFTKRAVRESMYFLVFIC